MPTTKPRSTQGPIFYHSTPIQVSEQKIILCRSENGLEHSSSALLKGDVIMVTVAEVRRLLFNFTLESRKTTCRNIFHSYFYVLHRVFALVLDIFFQLSQTLTPSSVQLVKSSMSVALLVRQHAAIQALVHVLGSAPAGASVQRDSSGSLMRTVPLVFKLTTVQVSKYHLITL